MKNTPRLTRAGRGWAYTAAGVGATVSILANIAHCFVPLQPHGLADEVWRGLDNAQPPLFAVVLAAFWPAALLLAIEVLVKVEWPGTARWSLVRWGGVTPVAVVAAVVSYRHLSGLLHWFGEDPVTVFIGPLAVDGLMAVATGALLATARSAPTAVGVTASTVADPTALPVDPTATPTPAPTGSPTGTPIADPTGTPDRAAPSVPVGPLGAVGSAPTPDPTGTAAPTPVGSGTPTGVVDIHEGDHAYVRRIRRDITQGRIKANPGAELIRKTYSVGTDRARRIRDLLQATTTDADDREAVNA